METQALLLSRSDVEQCLDVAGTVAIVEDVFRAHGQRKVVVPAKIVLDMSSLGIPGGLNAMPAYVEPARLCGIKVTGAFVDNPSKHGLPYIMASLMLLDPHSGVLVAVMDGVTITAMRTGAAAAVGARYLAREGAAVAAFVGCGVQASTSLQALNVVLDLAEIRAVDVRPEASQRLVQQAEGLGISGRALADRAKAVEGADVIVVATTAAEPLVMREWVRPGAYIAKLGSFQELDDALTLGADKLLVDHRGQAEHKGELAHLFGAGRITQADVYAELGDVVAGLVPGREADNEVIIAAMIGMGSEDVGVGSAVLRRARELGIGRVFDFLA